MATARPTRPRAPTPGPPALRLVTLGEFSVWRAGTPIGFVRQKARALLAMLLCAEGLVHREALIEWLWPEAPPEGGLRSLYVTLHTLRRALEPGLRQARGSVRVISDAQAYRLSWAERDEWDALTFLRLAGAAADAGPLASRITRLKAAAAAYTGPFLPQWPYEDWAVGRRGEVERAHELVLEGLAAGLLETGEYAAAIERYHALLVRNPEREGWHRGLMRAYAGSGERGLALRQYQSCQALLRQALGVEPSLQTQALAVALQGGGARAEASRGP
jgi:DNA-binding SARP family transcriptional activator